MDPRKMRKIFPLPFCCIIKSYNHIITKPLLSHAQGIKLNGVHKSPQYLVDGPISNSSTPDKALKKKILIILLGTQVLIFHAYNLLNLKLVPNTLYIDSQYISYYYIGNKCIFIVYIHYWFVVSCKVHKHILYFINKIHLQYCPVDQLMKTVISQV